MAASRSRVLHLLVCLALAAPAACGEPAPRTFAVPQPELVWPPPPLAPRVKFLHTVSKPQDLGIKSGFLAGVVRFLKGAPERRTSSPFGVDKDDDGRLYVVDTFHKAVQVFDATNGEHYWFPDGALADFESPIGVASGYGGRVYVSDSEAKVVHVFEDYGKRYLRAIGRDVLERPTGLVVNDTNGDLLVTDTLTSQVIVFDSDDFRAKRFVGREGEEADAFHYPTSIAVAGDGTIYVTDSLNFRIQVLGPDLSFRHRFGQAGDSPGHFSRPKGVAVDSDGHVYVVDALFDNVQIFDSEGRLLLAFGSPGAQAGQFWLPAEIFIDEEDRIYVADSYNQRLQVFQYLKPGDAQ
jgi:DNA-binding beta-propeller fold protein YncE